MLDYDEVVATIVQVEEDMHMQLKDAACSIIADAAGTLPNAKTAVGQIIGVKFFSLNLQNALKKLRED